MRRNILSHYIGDPPRDTVAISRRRINKRRRAARAAFRAPRDICAFVFAISRNSQIRCPNQKPKATTFQQMIYIYIYITANREAHRHPAQRTRCRLERCFRCVCAADTDRSIVAKASTSVRLKIAGDWGEVDLGRILLWILNRVTVFEHLASAAN